MIVCMCRKVVRINSRVTDVFCLEIALSASYADESDGSGLSNSELGISESVDSLCKDDADMPMPPYIRKAYNRPNAAFISLFR